MTDADSLAVLVHELRSPVAAIAAVSQTLTSARTVLEPDETRRLLLVAVAAGRDLERLLRDADPFSVEAVTVDLSDLVAGFAGGGVEVRAEPGLLVTGDPGRLRQVLSNLVDNGLRHAGAVRLDAAAHGAEAWVTVSDEGPGVAPGLDPFARGASGSGSTGLGLHVARTLAQAQGGALELVPSAAGACFRLALPRASDGRG